MVKYSRVIKALKIYIFRDSDESFSRGVFSQRVYDNDGVRRLVSLKICFMGWLLELFGTTFFSLLAPFLRARGFHYLYYPDAIVIFLLIPFLHVMNDEKIKEVILKRGWIQGLRNIIGKQNIVHPE